MNPEVGFGILPGLILPCMFRGGWKKNTISKKKKLLCPELPAGYYPRSPGAQASIQSDISH